MTLAMKITVVTTIGLKVELDVEPSTTIASIKDEVYQKTSIDPQQQRYMYNGAIVQNDQTLEGAQIPEGAEIRVILDVTAGV